MSIDSSEPEASNKPRRRPARKEKNSTGRRNLAIGLVASILIILLAAGGGYVLNRLDPTVVRTETAQPGPPTWKLALPLDVDGWSRNANEGASPSASGGKEVVSAEYSKPNNQPVIVLVNRPVTDGNAFMIEANMNSVSEVQGGWCGISADNDLDACLVIRSQAAILVMSKGDSSRTQLMLLTKKFAEAIAP